jgi:formylglycine-generating enzyme required for sulfatase activity
LLTTVVIDGVIASILRCPPLSNATINVIVALAVNQMSMAGIWMGLGRTPSPLRMLGAMGVFIAWAFLCGPELEAVVLMIPFATISVCLLLARWRGLYCVDTFDPVSRAESDRPRWQFSISSLLAWTTVLAIVLGVFKWLDLIDWILNPRFQMADAVPLAGLTLIAVAALWMALGARPFLRRTPALVLAEVVSISTAYVTEEPRVSANIAWCMVLDAVFLVGSLLVFRMAGYRVRWRRALATGSSASSAVPAKRSGRPSQKAKGKRPWWTWDPLKAAMPPRFRTPGRLAIGAGGLGAVLLLLAVIIYVAIDRGTIKLERKTAPTSAHTPTPTPTPAPAPTPTPAPRSIPAPATLSDKLIAVNLGNGVKLEMVRIPAGEFMMGSPNSDKDAGNDEKPQHLVLITKPFYLGKYLVTQEQWQEVMGNNPSYFKGPQNPVEQISWDDCQKFLDKLNGKLGAERGKFQLPSEAQWEYARRMGSLSICFADNDELGEYAWYDKNSGTQTHPVDGKKPNAWGLYDMRGHVWEWCQDWNDEGYYAKSPADDPTGPPGGVLRVLRGGSWADPARRCRSADRSGADPGTRANYLGFRASLVPAGR